MARTKVLQDSWHLGIRRDYSRSDMPAGSLWDAVDMIASYGTALRERAGWTHQSSDISAITSSSANATYVKGGAYVTFSNSAGVETSKNLCVSDDGHLFDVTNSTASHVGVGEGNTVIQNPVFHAGAAASAATAVFTGLLVIPLDNGNVPAIYDGTTYREMGGSPPQAKYATVYNDYTVLGNGSVDSTYYPNRIWFSPPGDPDCAVSSVTAWDTTDSWIDMPYTVKGLASVRNAMLVFHDSSLTRIRGSIPPPDEDMIVDAGLFTVGLYDPFSIATHRDNVIWASEEGVFRTDGSFLDDLTKRGGMSRYWLDLMSAADSSRTFAGGVYRSNYFITIMDGTTFKDCLVVNLDTASWSRLSNIDATSMWPGQSGKADELYWGRRGAARVSRMAPIYDFTAKAGASGYQDASGGVVAGSIQTPFYLTDPAGLKRFRRAYITYALEDNSTDSGTATASVSATTVLGAEGKDLTLFSLGSLAANPSLIVSNSRPGLRSRLPVQKQGLGIAFKITRDQGADEFELHKIEAEFTPYEQTRLQQ